MVAPAAPPPAALHLLTPGSPAYAMLKLGALGGIVALRFALVRKNRGKKEEPAAPAEAVEARPPARRDQHPVSKKKKRRRRR